MRADGHQGSGEWGDQGAAEYDQVEGWEDGDGGVPCGFAGGIGVKDFVEETEMGAPVPAGHS